MTLDSSGIAQPAQFPAVRASMMVRAAADGLPRYESATGRRAVGATLADLLRGARNALIWQRSPGEAALDLWDFALTWHDLDRRALFDPEALCSCREQLAGHPLAEHVRVAESGGELERRLDAVLVVDRRVAALLPRTPESEPPTLVIGDAAVAEAVAAAFDLVWPSARCLRPANPIDEMLESNLKREIIRRLVGGEKDETIARSLNVSLRTCRRHIADIMSATDAVSRFQAGFRIGQDTRAVAW
ncbi:helix-turn-helix transcriptional regulator [Actinacidiphila yeochonensis]|uniref:helix-turn-helix transcriptional regulator n=1 Tax=Actinacidiphila yeochonensis TaxID=89050 RepID=UPI00068CFCA4|nr:hypothetical protein [Actinacidiphila yeochonensis]